MADDITLSTQKNQITLSSLSTGATTFKGLSDTPSSYSGESLKYVRVKNTEDGLEFAAAAIGGDTIIDVNSSNVTAPNFIDSSEIEWNVSTSDITASVVAGSIDETKLDTSVNASLDLADSAIQPGEIVFNVKDYGAVGDGVAEDQGAINDAIQAAHEAGGGTVYFPAGIYKVERATEAQLGTYWTDLSGDGMGSLPCILLLSGVNLVGEGENTTTIIRTSTTGSLGTIKASNLGGFTITHLGFEGARDPADYATWVSYGDSEILDFKNGCHTWRVMFCRFENTLTEAIDNDVATTAQWDAYETTGQKSLVYGCVFKNLGGCAVHNAIWTDVENCYFKKVGLARLAGYNGPAPGETIGQGAVDGSAHEVTIRNSYFSECARLLHGYLTYPGTGDVRNCLVDNCYVADTISSDDAEAPIWGYDHIIVRDTTILGQNTRVNGVGLIENCEFIADWTETDLANVVLPAGGSVIGSKIKGYGFLLNGAKCSLIDNEIDKTQSTINTPCIQMPYSTNNDTLITGNRCWARNTAGGTAAVIGSVSTSTQARNIITNNKVDGGGYSNHLVRIRNDSTVVGNVLLNGASSSVTLGNDDGSSTGNNIVTDNISNVAPLVRSGSTDNIIRDNTPTSSSNSGTWGEIGGTLSNQTDLQSAIDLKYDSADFNTDWDTRFATKDSDDITEGSTNLYSQWSTSGTDVYYNSGDIGINTSNPVALLDVRGKIQSGNGTTGTGATGTLVNYDTTNASIYSIGTTPGYQIWNDTTPTLANRFIMDALGDMHLDVYNGSLWSTGIMIESSGTQVGLGNFIFNADQTVGAGQDNYVLTYDHSSGEISLEASTGGGYTNLTQFVDQTAWRVFYSNTDGDVTELSLGADGTFLKSNGATSAPTWATPAGSGDVSKVGTPVDNQVGVWTGDGTIEGTSGLTYDGSALDITGNITVSGTVDGVDIASRDHDAVTVSDSAEIDFTLTGQDITASLIAGSIDETKLDTSVNASLDLADSALQSGDNISELVNDSGYITATLTNEQVQDIVGAMVSTNTETLITVTYQDADGTLDFVVDNDLSNYSNATSGFITGNETITLSGDITGSGTTAITTTIAAGSVDIAMLSATGTADSSTYLRGDGTWTTPAGSSPLTTKGDVYTYSTSDTRLAVGTNGTVLMADSGETTGLKWGTPVEDYIDGGSITSITSSSGVATPNAANGKSQKFPLTENVSDFNPPTNLDDGGSMLVQVLQDSTPRTFALDAGYTVMGAGTVDDIDGLTSGQYAWLTITRYGSDYLIAITTEA